jgi:hypothetical protein
MEDTPPEKQFKFTFYSLTDLKTTFQTNSVADKPDGFECIPTIYKMGLKRYLHPSDLSDVRVFHKDSVPDGWVTEKKFNWMALTKYIDRKTDHIIEQYNYLPIPDGYVKYDRFKDDPSKPNNYLVARYPDFRYHNQKGVHVYINEDTEEHRLYHFNDTIPSEFVRYSWKRHNQHSVNYYKKPIETANPTWRPYKNNTTDDVKMFLVGVDHIPSDWSKIQQITKREIRHQLGGLIDYDRNKLYPEIFNYNKYTKYYLRLVNYRLDNPYVGGRVDRHHVLPASVMGCDEPNNIVHLSYREHLWAHKVLTKCMASDQGKASMLVAAYLMYRINQKSNSLCKIKYTKQQIEEMHENHAEYSRKMVTYSLPEHGLVKKFIPGTEPEGWVKGNSKIQGKLPFYNPETLVTKRFKPGTEPEGWVLGDLNSRGKVYYSHPETLKSKQFVPGTEPVGWIKGNLRIAGKSYYFHPETLESNMFTPGTEPDGWVKGNVKMKDKVLFSDPETLVTKWFYPGSEPDGWIKGNMYKVGKIYYYNPDTLETKSFIPDTEPAGWIKGDPLKRGKMIYSHPDEPQSKLFIPGTEPDGWVRGAFNKQGKCYYHDPVTLVTSVYTPGSEPDGWVSGVAKKRGKTNYYNPTTLNSKHFTPGTEPEGWIKGDPLKRGKMLFNNPETLEMKWFTPGTEPDGWVKGNSKKKSKN